jgi:hypothetical protein
MNSLWDIRIFLGLVPKESPCIMRLINGYSRLISYSLPFSLKEIRWNFCKQQTKINIRIFYTKNYNSLHSSLT